MIPGGGQMLSSSATASGPAPLRLWVFKELVRAMLRGDCVWCGTRLLGRSCSRLRLGKGRVHQMFLSLRWPLLFGGTKSAGGVHGWVRGVPKSLNAAI
jgi:hypothetical protein